MYMIEHVKSIQKARKQHLDFFYKTWILKLVMIPKRNYMKEAPIKESSSMIKGTWTTSAMRENPGATC